MKENIWYDPKEKPPDYYAVVIAELTNGNEEAVWRSNDGDKDIYTIFKNRRIFDESEVVKWRLFTDLELKR
jgi:hypothetical protein